ncbi:MAG: RagB/SusD family nutrient uptake outer membrane protein [Alistipes sp.]|nr:RagB/SusD family nutrient uptake outer membrane protein [Alistipes sp.]
MKKIISMLAMAALAATTLSSCVEDAEVTAYLTPDKKNEIAAENPDKVFAAQVAGIYSDIQSYVYSNMQHNYFGQKSFDYLTSLMGNDMIMTGRYGMSIYHYLFDYWQQDYNATLNRWRQYYRLIDSANQIIASIAEDEVNPDVLKYKAIALAVRGYAYLHLSYLYGLPYYMGADDTVWGKGQQYDNANALCVPIVTETLTGDQPRSTVAQVYTQLMGDLKTAYDLFESFGMVKTASPTDIDGSFAAMYLARAHMIKHEWSEAAKYAQVIVDNYPVLTGNDILQGFSNINLPDVVYGCDITADNSGIYMSWFSQMDMFGDGYAGIGVWRAGFKPFVDRISDTDIRLDWFWTPRNLSKLASEFGMIGAYVYYQSCKFIGGGRSNVRVVGSGDDAYLAGANWHLGDYIYLRSEEAHFILAEALAHQGSDDAVDVLNDFMVTRDPNYAYTFSSKAALIEEINYQKRVEFWGEGIEYLDNRRLNIPIDRTDATWGAANNHFSGAKYALTQDAKNFLYQIPMTEIDNNSMIDESEQN